MIRQHFIELLDALDLEPERVRLSTVFCSVLLQLLPPEDRHDAIDFLIERSKPEPKPKPQLRVVK